jgi:hypothetical protein
VTNEPTHPARISGLLTQLASGLTFAAFAAQLIAYSIALGYYARFGLKPDQLGINPLNAVLRLGSTGHIIGGLATALSGGILWFAVKRAGSSELFNLDNGGEWRVRKFRRRGPILIATRNEGATKTSGIFYRSSTLVLLVASILIFLSATSSTLGWNAAERSTDVDARYSLLSVTHLIKGDLGPRPSIMYWTKESDYPALLFLDVEEASIPIRRVLVFGASEGVTYAYDLELGQTLRVPSSLIQVIGG